MAKTRTKIRNTAQIPFLKEQVVFRNYKTEDDFAFNLRVDVPIPRIGETVCLLMNDPDSDDETFLEDMPPALYGEVLDVEWIIGETYAVFVTVSPFPE